MAGLPSLLKDLERALKSKDMERIASVRRTIVTGHPGTTECAEAAFKLGMDALFRRKDIDEAVKYFRTSAQAKSAAWSPQARLSLGSLLLRQGKHQQAVFEFRRVAGASPPTLISAQAAGFVVMALREAGKGTDADRARGQHLDLLQKLCKNRDPEVASSAQFMLGMEHKHDGSRGPARAALEKALGVPELPADYRSVAENALRML